MTRSKLPDDPFPKELKKVLKDNNHGVMSEEAQVYQKILNLLKTVKCINLTESHYFQLLKFALYLEEYQCELDMRKYDLRKKKIVKTDADRFRISIENEWPDVEEMPMIKTNDLIDIIDTTDRKPYALSIKEVTEKFIEASGEMFLERYSERKLYDIQFRYQNYPNRCNHFALWLAYQRNIITHLFPNNVKPSLIPTIYDSKGLKIFNPTIESNKEQVQAVFNILCKSSFPKPYILYGPPGTGKTATIVESICQIVNQKDSNYILVCTPSNTAADEVTKRLLDYIEPELLYRMYSGSKDPLTIDKKILPCCNYEDGKICSFIKYEIVSRKRIVITTLCNSIKLILIGLPQNHFSHVIIDEAGQSIEPDILIPVSLVSANGKIHSQIVLAGDPKQLGPTVISRLAQILLGKSILERLMSCPIYQSSGGHYNPKFITKLLINYRSHPKIIEISNELFYNKELIPRPTTKDDKFPVIFHEALGKEQKIANSKSSRNNTEINAVLKKIKELLRNKENDGSDEISQQDIGIVTPFKLQSQEIKRALARCNLKDINVGTVELFQGQEKKIIIISAVRAKTFSGDEGEHIGSLSNPKRFNVAVTRAKSMLVVIGNPRVLQIDPSWQYLLKYCIDNNSYRGSPLKLKVLPDNPSATTETLSSDLFKWKKFKIFQLDKSDSNADVVETRRMILNSTVKTPSSTINRGPWKYSTNSATCIRIKKEKKSWCTIL